MDHAMELRNYILRIIHVWSLFLSIRVSVHFRHIILRIEFFIFLCFMCFLFRMIFYFDVIFIEVRIYKGRYTYDSHENCPIFKTPYPPCPATSKILQPP